MNLTPGHDKSILNVPSINHVRVSDDCSLGFVQIDAGKEHEHHEDWANVLDFNAIFFECERVSIFLFSARPIFRR